MSRLASSILFFAMIAAQSIDAPSNEARAGTSTDGAVDTWEGKSAEQWAKQLAAPDIGGRWYAAYVLGQLGPKGAEAIPSLHDVLAKHLEHEYVRGTAAWALGRMGPKAESEIPLLMETMHSRGHVSVRRNATEALGNFGAAAKKAVPELVKQLGDDDPVTCVQAAVSLWKIERHPKAMPALIEMLRRGESPAAYETAVALGRLGSDAEAAAPALVEALHLPDADVRRAAALSIGQIGRPAFSSLKKSLDDPDEEVRRLVVEALGWMGTDAIKPLIAALANDKPSVRRAAARALGRIGPEARAAESALVVAANDPDEEVQAAAAKALHRVRGE